MFANKPSGKMNVGKGLAPSEAVASQPSAGAPPRPVDKHRCDMPPQKFCFCGCGLMSTEGLVLQAFGRDPIAQLMYVFCMK